MKTRLRTATKKDINQIITIAKQVHRIVLKHRKKFFGKIKEFRGDANFYLKIMKHKDSKILVAEDANLGVVGYIFATVETKSDDLIAIPYVSINEISIKEGHRGGGVGNLLMEAVHKWALQKGIKVIQLAVWEFNKNAIKFYTKIGYKTIMRKMEKILIAKK